MAKNIHLDQFYTAPYEVEKCIQAITDAGIDISKYDICLEPSAGTGAFYVRFSEHNRVGLDLDPKYPGIIKQNFFDYSPSSIFNLENKSVITVGNPPYGRAGNLAVKFVNRCSEWSDYVCMVLPRSFNKDSIKNRINANMHLIHSHLVSDFILPDGTVHKVNSVFQIWERRNERRAKTTKSKVTNLWDWTTPEKADCAMIFFGTPTGKLKTEGLTELTRTTHAFMKSRIPLSELKELFILGSKEIVDTYRESNTAAGSLSKGDVVEIVEKYYQK